MKELDLGSAWIIAELSIIVVGAAVIGLMYAVMGMIWVLKELDKSFKRTRNRHDHWYDDNDK